MNLRFASCAILLIAGSMLAGCNVEEHKNGDKDNVNISTPFGGVHIKTNDDATTTTGLAVYPGAVPVKDDNGKDNDSADINLSFGDFHLGVKAASFQSADPPAKVEAFYRKDLSRYGDVIKCEGHTVIGQPTRTSQGLTCDDDDDKKNHNHIHGNLNTDDGPELRAGSPQHQHIVGIEPKNGGTKIGLVALDLPKGMNSHDDGDSE